jgi:hypothetical protein
MTFSWKTLAIQIAGLAISALLFQLIRMIFRSRFDYSGFLKDSQGNYSLSKLQAVIWAVVIISLQISIIICALYNPAANFSDFKLVFAKNTLILLGLSLGSYVTVKGITTSQATASKNVSTGPGSLSDIISDSNGLDFSKFQMLIWTLIAVLDFFAICHNYLYGILTDPLGISLYFNVNSETAPYSLPTVESTFLILMGISQGAYIAKKLVPVDDAKAATDSNIASTKAESDKLGILIDSKNQQIKTLEEKGNQSDIEKQQLLNLKVEMVDLNAKQDKYKRDLASLS